MEDEHSLRVCPLYPRERRFPWNPSPDTFACHIDESVKLVQRYPFPISSHVYHNLTFSSPLPPPRTTNSPTSSSRWWGPWRRCAMREAGCSGATFSTPSGSSHYSPLWRCCRCVDVLKVSLLGRCVGVAVKGVGSCSLSCCSAMLNFCWRHHDHLARSLL